MLLLLLLLLMLREMKDQQKMVHLLLNEACKMLQAVIQKVARVVGIDDEIAASVIKLKQFISKSRQLQYYQDLKTRF